MSYNIIYRVVQPKILTQLAKNLITVVSELSILIVHSLAAFFTCGTDDSYADQMNQYLVLSAFDHMICTKITL